MKALDQSAYTWGRECNQRGKLGRTDDGVFLLQGDIRIAQSDVSRITAPGNTGRKKRALMRDRTRLWQSPINYEISPRLSTEAKTAIASAIKTWQSVLPCIKWVRGKVPKKPLLYFFSGDGCFSDVGRTRDTRQEISIGNGCEEHGTVVHEIAHALGFWHEQSRQDRDRYVKIHWNNIIPRMRHNFDKYSTSTINNHGVPYDYDSVMHYGPYDFTKQDGLRTMTSLMGNLKFGDKSNLSKLDIKQARLLYNCHTGTKIIQPPPSPSTSPIGGSGSGGGPI